MTFIPIPALRCLKPKTKITIMTDTPKKIDIRAAKLLLAENPKDEAFDFLAARVEEEAGPDASFEEMKRALAVVRRDEAKHFRKDDKPVEKMTAYALLEKANADAATAKQKVAREPLPGKLELTDAERAKLQRMTPDQRHAWANARAKKAMKK